MKKLKLPLIIFSAMLLQLTIARAQQVPQTLTYQSVLRNNSNVLLSNTAVGIKISVLQGSASGSEIFSETQAATTNANGLLSLQIGAGNAVTGAFANIDWANGPYFIKTETDPTGGSNYSIVGTQQLASVPYALYAAKSGGTAFETTVDDPNAIHNVNQGNVGIGTDLPYEKLDVNGNVRVRENLYVAGYIAAINGISVSQNLVVNGDNFTVGNSDVGGTAKANSFVKLGGQANEYLMADGSVSTGSLGSNAFETTAMDPTAIHNSNTGNVGIGTDLPFEKLDVAGNVRVRQDLIVEGTVRIPFGNPEQGKVLTSDFMGNATWQTPATPDLTSYATITDVVNLQSDVNTLQDQNMDQGMQLEGLNTVLFNTNNQLETNTTAIAILQNQLSNGSGGSGVFVPSSGNPENIFNSNPGNVGIGTDTPSEKLDVAGNAKVSGKLSANGGNSIGGNSTALGFGTNASGNYSTAMGISSTSIGEASTAMGIGTNASGNLSTAMGAFSTAKSFAETTIGTNNTDYAPNSTNSYDASDRLFVIGNGADENTKSDAMVVLKNGNTSINGEVTVSSIKIPNGLNTQYLMADGSLSTGGSGGASTVGAIDPTATTNGAVINNGVLSLTPADATNGGIVTTGDQTFSGNKRFNSDININGVTVGHGSAGADFILQFNTAFGSSALNNNYGGFYNTAIGLFALDNNFDGKENVGVGAAALSTNVSGNKNSALGNYADVTAANLTNATAIGFEAKVDASNRIQLGNTAVTLVKTSGKVTAGAVTYPNTDGTAGQVLQTNGLGTLSWVSPQSGSVGSVTAIAGTSNANGATISDGNLTLTPADATNGGIVTNSAQTFAGNKTFTGTATANSFVKAGGTASQILMADGTSTATIRGYYYFNNGITTITGNGFTVTRVLAGRYRINFSSPFTTTPCPIVTITSSSINTAGSVTSVITNAVSANSFEVITFNSGSPFDYPFYFIVMAP